MLKKLYQYITSPDNEKEKLLAFVDKIAKSNKTKILDVGCGYGRYLKPLQSKGYDIVGVDKNEAIVNENKKNGLNCISLEALQEMNVSFDLIICAHIIEHFTPTELFSFLDYYLSKLNKGGYLIIATPLYTHYFYDDFDHVKPYHPEGLQMVFGGKDSQVQYTSDQHMVLRDIWFRKSPMVSAFHRAKYFKSPMTRVLQLKDLLMSLLYRVSLGFIGKKDGWIGVFQKSEGYR
ncbi:MAG: class I SAM-dependent methyltransferase [Proteobacteria bacterium]|nr:class I SAM-dependent methyltransferase [Pseudomonadota bacterium]